MPFEYQNQEVTSAEVVEVRVKNETNAQRRNFNYVVRLNSIDPETNEPIMVNEYRTYATDSPLDTETILRNITDLIERGFEEI